MTVVGETEYSTLSKIKLLPRLLTHHEEYKRKRHCLGDMTEFGTCTSQLEVRRFKVCQRPTKDFKEHSEVISTMRKARTLERWPSHGRFRSIM